MLLQHRHGYAADFLRGLLAEGHNPASESPSEVGVRCIPAHIHQIWSRCLSLEER